ncbi:MAG: metallophosphoesterase family protein, partial [Bradyrhizobium sp.]|uniref:metallophosphoesterase family protein n=1 Tax=Bradyrhizobium sp. TaxID=376 RepID=UPI003919DBDB
LKRHGVELVLHGHDHIHSTMWFDGPERKIPAIGVPSASALARKHYPAAAYNLFSIERDGNAWRCEQIVRGLGDHDGTPIAGIFRSGPSNHIVEWMWSWPCSTSSTPCRLSSASN